MKLKLNAIGALIILCAFVLTHERIEYLSLNMGLSWTFSKIAPYLLQFITLVFLSTLLSQLFGVSFGRKKLILISSIVLLSGISFAINPIYEGDFDNTYEELIVKNIEDEFNEGLTMVALPGCPYCLDRIKTLNKLNNYNKNIPITVLIIESDSLSISNYAQQLPSMVQIVSAKNSKQISELVGGSFPSFIYRKKEETILYFWSQIGFGAGAMDWISEQGKTSSIEF